jgi:putative glycerol kinase 5
VTLDRPCQTSSEPPFPSAPSSLTNRFAHFSLPLLLSPLIPSPFPLLLTPLDPPFQASLFGNCCFNTGEAKCTFGTGLFLTANAGPTPITPSRYVLYPLIGWKIGDELCYIVEGVAKCAGQILDWGKDASMYERVEDADSVAASVPDTKGTCFVSNFNGVAAPYFDPTARAAFMGITQETSQAHMVRAMLESIAFTFMDMFDFLLNSAGIRPSALKVDGGVSRSDFVTQMVADLSEIPIQRATDVDSTAMGAAFLAGLDTGFFRSREQLRESKKWKDVKRPAEKVSAAVLSNRKCWSLAVQRTLNWPQLG